MHLGLTKSRDDKLLQDLLDKKLRVIVVFEDDYLNHIARIAYKDIQQDNYTYRIGEYNIYKGEEWGFCDFCKRHDCYFIVPNETIEGSSSEISNDLEEAAKEYAKTLFTRPYSDTPEEVITIIEPEKFAGFIAGAKWQKEQMMKEAVEADVNIYRDLVAGKSWAEFVVEMPTNNLGDKVRVISKNTYRLMMIVEDLKRQRLQAIGVEYNHYSDAIKKLNHCIKEIQTEMSRIALCLSNQNY